jgi:hypothetical protein
LGKLPDIDFERIRVLDGDRRKGFEQLVCQLFRRQPPLGASEYRRVEGAGGDGGVEAYWIDADGNDYGVQAKYFNKTKAISWAQVDKSVKTALQLHPKLKAYTIAFACDLTGRSGLLGLGKTGWDHWDQHRASWENLAAKRGMSVAFSVWTKDTIIDDLAKDPDRRGLILFWFDTDANDAADGRAR